MKVIHLSHLPFLQYILHCLCAYIALSIPTPKSQTLWDQESYSTHLWALLLLSLKPCFPSMHHNAFINQLLDKCLWNVIKFCGLGREKEPWLSEFCGNLSQSEVRGLNRYLPSFLNVLRMWVALVIPKTPPMIANTCLMSSLPLEYKHHEGRHPALSDSSLYS